MNDVPFYAIDFTLQEPKTDDNKRFEVRGFLYDNIYEENLIKRLEKAAEDLFYYYEKSDSEKDFIP